ncbi:NosD domain-containing protein [Microbacterium aurum]
MTTTTRYDVTTWPHGDATDDIGAVINDIISAIKSDQREQHVGDGGKPGGVIYIPPGDYRLRTPVHVDISFLRIEGSGHGFTSSSIRFNVPAAEVGHLHELWPGGSRVLVDLPGDGALPPNERAAFVVARTGSPRISSVEFAGFCIDGLHFTGEGPGGNPENSYRNGRIGILAAEPNDSLRIIEMGVVYLEHGLWIEKADALTVHDNFIAECGNAIELREWGQATKVTDNLIGAGPNGHSIYAENHGGLLIAANNVFPRGSSSVHLTGVKRSSVTANRLHSFYPGMVIFDGGSSENLLGANHLLRDLEPWTPFFGVDNGIDDDYGLIRIEGDGNSIIGNHISEVVDPAGVRPAGAAPVIVRIATGVGNHIADNHTVASVVTATANDECFEGQVDALLSGGEADELAVTTVMVDAAARRNTILDSGRDDQVILDRRINAFRATPGIPTDSPEESL